MRDIVSRLFGKEINTEIFLDNLPDFDYEIDEFYPDLSANHVWESSVGLLPDSLDGKYIIHPTVNMNYGISYCAKMKGCYITKPINGKVYKFGEYGVVAIRIIKDNGKLAEYDSIEDAKEAIKKVRKSFNEYKEFMSQKYIVVGD